MDRLTREFLEYEKSNNLGLKTKKILLAHSGGPDSTALFYIFLSLGYRFEVAHVNYGLRGQDSMTDEAFVKSECKHKKIHFHTKRVDTLKYAEKHKLSIQMAAREIRYSWFNELRMIHKFDCVVTAHHLNDSIETMLLNLIKGAGINGITGIKPVNDYIIRPLLFTDKNAIYSYLKDHNIKYRKDETNERDDYQRNYLRNRIIPLLQDLNPSLTQTLKNELNIFQCVADIYNTHIDNLKKQLITGTDTKKLILINSIRDLKYPEVILYDLLKDFNFNLSVLLELIKNLDGQSGKEYLSPTHKILKDREYLIISPIDKKVANVQEFQLPFQDNNTIPPIEIKLEITNNSNLIFSDDKNIALLNCEKVSLPLKVRKWKPGDVFYPLGANGKQKLSDFFVNNKVPKTDKENTYVVMSEDEIVWVVGHRIDDRFKISPDTTSILKLTLKN